MRGSLVARYGKKKTKEGNNVSIVTCNCAKME